MKRGLQKRAAQGRVAREVGIEPSGMRRGADFIMNWFIHSSFISYSFYVCILHIYR